MREEKAFTKAEMKMFAKKYEVFLEAQKEVDEIVVFLKEQHGVADQEGWQIGQNGFFRETTTAAPTGEEEKEIQKILEDRKNGQTEKTPA